MRKLSVAGALMYGVAALAGLFFLAVILFAFREE